MARIQWVGVALLLVLAIGALQVFDRGVALSFLGGGVLGLVNFRVMVWLFTRIVEGGAGASWYALPLVGKFMFLLAAILVAGFWLRADVLALATGFSTIVIVVVLLSSVRYLGRHPSS